MYEEQVASLARHRLQFPNLISDLDLRNLMNYVPEPASILGALGAHVLVQTLLFAAVCALMVVLNLSGRPIWAVLAPAAMITGVVISAGPLAFLPLLLGGPLTGARMTVRSHEYVSYVPFAAPLWWRLSVAAAVTLPFAGAWFLTRRPQRQPMAFGKTLSALGLFGLTVEITILVVPKTLAADAGDLSKLLPTAAVLLVVGCGAAVAGSTGAFRRGAVTAVAVALMGAAAWIPVWILYEMNEGPVVSAWEQHTGETVMWVGTWPLIALVLAAGGLGWVAGLARQVLTAQRPSGLTMFGRPESPSLHV